MALITLKEYAERLGKNPVIVYQKARYGTLKTAFKLGRDWVIDENEPYEDKRIKSGKYVDWKYGYKYQKERKAIKAAEEAAKAEAGPADEPPEADEATTTEVDPPTVEADQP